jgi:hypothetical protein
VLSVLYASNVEMYVFRDGRYPQFVDNLQRLPRQPRSTIIRSIFDRSSSTSALQPANDVIANFRNGRYRTYWDLIASSR